MKLIKLNLLNLTHPLISAASSLLSIDGRLFVVNDDQYGLYELKEGEKWAAYHWQEAPDLPSDHLKRKKVKPDFEALLWPFFNEEEVLLVPSGSRKNRMMGLIFNLTSNTFTPFDLNDFFLNLSLLVSSINIEGAAFFNGHIYFLNRGVQNQLSTLIKIHPHTFEILALSTLDFGSIKETPLHGSELCVYEGFLYALAVAEVTSNSYDDGAILGSAFYKISLETFQIIDQWIFDRPIKTEGLSRWQNNWIVTTDSDGEGQSDFYSFRI